MLAMMVFLPFAGTFSDRVGRKNVWWFSLVGLFVAAIPMFLLMKAGTVGAMAVSFSVLRSVVRAATRQHLGDVSRDVPDAGPLCRDGDRL